MARTASLTVDSLFNGRVILRQPKEGYRFSLDAILLAGLTRVEAGDRVMDLGTGCGVVAIVFAHRGQARQIVGLELQEELAGLARWNVAENGLENHVKIDAMDYRRVSAHYPSGSFDLLVANPPYRRLQAGRMNPHGQKARARHELTGSVREVFAAARHLLPVGGRVALIYPAVRLVHLVVSAEEHGFAPKELTMIHSDPSGTGRLVHVECRKGGGEELKVKPPFFIYDEKGAHTHEMQQLYEERLPPSRG